MPYGQPVPDSQFGPPPVPSAGSPPPPPPPPRGRSRLLWLIPAGAVVLVAVIVAVLLTGGGGKGSSAGSQGPAGSGTSAAAQLGAWETTSQQQYDAMGAVTYGSELVITADTGVYAYDRANGKPLWTVRPPATGSNGTAFCGSGQNAVNGRLPVGFGPVTSPSSHMLNCTSVGLIDLQSGKMAWTQQIPTAAALKTNPLSTPGVLTEISGSTVVATWNSVAAAFSVTTGHRLWTQSYSDEFRDLAVADGRFYALFTSVAPLPGEAPMALDGISPATGAITSRLHMTAKMSRTGTPYEGAIVSTSPMTLLVSDQSANNNASYVVLDPTRQHITHVIPAGAQFPGNGQHLLDGMTVGGNAGSHPYIKGIVSNGMLLAVSYPGGAQSQLIAYDVATGAKRWSVGLPGVSMIAPVAVAGSAVIAVGQLNAGHGDATLVRVSLASGKVLSSTPRPTGKDAIGLYLANYHFTWSDGRVYAIDWDQAPIVPDIPEVFTMPAGG